MLQVLVVEKGRYTKAADLSLLERDAFQNMYEGCGLATTDDAGDLQGLVSLLVTELQHSKAANSDSALHA